MSRVVEVTWSARPSKSEGIYIEPQTECRVLESPGTARVYAHGPPPMNIELEVSSPSDVVDSDPLLLPGARIEAPASGQ